MYTANPDSSSGLTYFAILKFEIPAPLFIATAIKTKILLTEAGI